MEYISYLSWLRVQTCIPWKIFEHYQLDQGINNAVWLLEAGAMQLEPSPEDITAVIEHQQDFKDTNKCYLDQVAYHQAGNLELHD